MPTAARQLVNLNFFMRSFDVCSPLGFSKAGVLHFGLGRKYYISLLVTISLKKALFCPTSLERAEQMSSLCCFSSLLRMKGPILAGSSYLCKFSLRMIHKIIGCQSWTRDLQHIYSNLYYLWRETEAHRGYEDFAVSNHVLEQTKLLNQALFCLGSSVPPAWNVLSSTHFHITALVNTDCTRGQGFSRRACLSNRL